MSREDILISTGDIERQREFMEKNKELLLDRSPRPLAYVDTYGCQQNEADSETLRGMLREMGCDLTRTSEEADVIVVNTCAVREHAEMRVFGNVGALVHGKRAKRGQIIAVCGCMVQQKHVADRLKVSFPYVDMVFGPHALWRFPELLHEKLAGGRRIFETEDSDGVIAEGLPVSRLSGVKAWVPIMYGCNNFCSYCVVPYVRGRERSRDPQAVIDEVRALAESGYRDITLLGQNVNSYGRDLGGGTDFADLLRELNSLDGDFLLRFMTSHPKDATEKLFETMADCEKVAKHIHLPFQSGNDRVLAAMNRGYTQEKYFRLTDTARRTIPGLVLTSDVIVGFPGETEEEFEDTLDLVGSVGFHALFTFIYSPREGTPAAALPDPATREEKLQRFNRLVDLQNSISARRHGAYVGGTYRVLVDGENPGNEYNLTSRTNGGRLVHLKGDRKLVGSYLEARITRATTWALFGDISGEERP